MHISTYELCNRLRVFRSGLAEDRWMLTVQPPVLGVFNELASCAKKRQPADPILRAIEPARGRVKPATLCALVDQILIALEE